MTATAVRTLLTADEFYESGQSKGFELIHGVPREICMGMHANWIGIEMSREIGNTCAGTGCGTVAGFETPLAVWTDNRHFRKPDVLFYRRGRLGKIPSGIVRILPDLIVEVISPGDSADEFELKLKDYREARVPLVWVIYPLARHAVIYREGHASDPVADVLEAPDLLPGFRLDLQALFAAAEREDL